MRFFQHCFSPFCKKEEQESSIFLLIFFGRRKTFRCIRIEPFLYLFKIFQPLYRKFQLPPSLKTCSWLVNGIHTLHPPSVNPDLDISTLFNNFFFKRRDGTKIGFTNTNPLLFSYELIPLFLLFFRKALFSPGYEGGSTWIRKREPVRYLLYLLVPENSAKSVPRSHFFPLDAVYPPPETKVHFSSRSVG